jgi:hypothetical protein
MAISGTAYHDQACGSENIASMKLTEHYFGPLWVTSVNHPNCPVS